MVRNDARSRECAYLGVSFYFAIVWAGCDGMRVVEPPKVGAGTPGVLFVMF